MKAVIKQILFMVCALLMAPITLLYFVFSSMLKKDTVLTSYSQLLSLLPGKLGVYLRAGFYRFVFTHCSPDAVISFMVLFSQADTEIAEGVYLGAQCNIGRSSIGKNTLLGSGVHVMSGKGQHNFDDLEIPIKDQGGVLEKITIGENCWIGNGAMIMAHIGDSCIVGAGSVVINDIPAHSIAAGNPAKVIKSRLD
ncbi:MAG: virginiamycin A acetyltransferase [Paraglaciecola sp.]|jgi:virginiamycin A acetyltransferase